MRRIPAEIGVPESRDEIVKEVKRLIRAAGVEGVVPTPRDRILECAKLVQTGDLDLSNYEETLKTKARDFLYQALQKIRGFLDHRSNIVYVDPALYPTKHTFVTYHEVVHKTLSWQRVLYTSDDDFSLSSECRQVFESEANFGAAEILFQGEEFEKRAADYSVSIASALDLANQFEASAHSSIRRFVERNHYPCAVLVLKPTSRIHESGLTSYVICYRIESPSFVLEFGDPFSKRFLNPDMKLCQVVNNATTEEITLTDVRGETKRCTAEVFGNGHHIFLMIAPARSKRSRFTAILNSQRAMGA